MENIEDNSEKMGKIQTKIGKRYDKYGTKVSWIVKRFEKYRRELWNDMENMEQIVKRFVK